MSKIGNLTAIAYIEQLLKPYRALQCSDNLIELNSMKLYSIACIEFIIFSLCFLVSFHGADTWT